MTKTPDQQPNLLREPTADEIRQAEETAETGCVADVYEAAGVLAVHGAESATEGWTPEEAEMIATSPTIEEEKFGERVYYFPSKPPLDHPPAA